MADFAHDLVPDAGFVEVADRCWVARHRWFDVNVSVVGGEHGLLVVDTHASERAGRQVAELVAALPGEVVAVVNTHEHFDHTFGNGVFARDGIPVHAHETAAARTVEAGEQILRLYDDEPDDPHREEVQATEIVAATETFSSVKVLDLGGRPVELLHLGRGHTGGDCVVRVEDADLMLAGDLVEETVREGSVSTTPVPGFGSDCYPMEWPATLDLLISLLTSTTIVVPGHGLPVGKDFVDDQRVAIGTVAETIRDLASRGVTVADALDAASWPFPQQDLDDAVRRGYEHLPRTSKTLPLV